MSHTAAFLEQFCAAEDSKYILSKPLTFTHPETDQKYSYATDGHRLIIVDGEIEGLQSGGGPNITQFLIPQSGVPVSVKAFKAFLECDKPTTEKCLACDGRGKKRHDCNCDRCHGDYYDDCFCDGKPQRIVKRGLINDIALNRSLLSEMMKDVKDKSVLIHTSGPEDCIHVFASDRHLVVMPMRHDDSFKGAPRFTIAKAEQP